MNLNNYTKAQYAVAIELTKPSDDVFNHLIDLSKWWPEQFAGENLKPGVEFILKTGDEHYSKNKIIEFVPGKKLVWLTIESFRKADNYDWSGTKFIFELKPQASNTVLQFTYDGLVAENEKERLVQICNFCIKVCLYNFIESVAVAIDIPKPAGEIFKIITADVSKWWGGKDLTGSTTKLNDEFVIHHPGAHYSKQKLIEIIPEKRLVWLVTESNLCWLQNNKAEWTGTKMIFELSNQNNSTLINFTHCGLVPAMESFKKVQQGWDTVIKDYLYNYIMEGKIAQQLL